MKNPKSQNFKSNFTGFRSPKSKTKVVFEISIKICFGGAQNPTFWFFNVAWRKLARVHNLLYTLPTLFITRNICKYPFFAARLTSSQTPTKKPRWSVNSASNHRCQDYNDHEGTDMTTDVSVGVRWDPLNQSNEGNEEFEFDYDGGNSSSRLFERSRIKALAGKKHSKILEANYPGSQSDRKRWTQQWPSLIITINCLKRFFTPCIFGLGANIRMPLYV